MNAQTSRQNRYLVALNGKNPTLGGFLYRDRIRAVSSLCDLRKRWPHAVLVDLGWDNPPSRLGYERKQSEVKNDGRPQKSAKFRGFQ